jgi:hypothetical protein
MPSLSQITVIACRHSPDMASWWRLARKRTNHLNGRIRKPTARELTTKPPIHQSSLALSEAVTTRYGCAPLRRMQYRCRKLV